MSRVSGPAGPVSLVCGPSTSASAVIGMAASSATFFPAKVTLSDSGRSLRPRQTGQMALVMNRSARCLPLSDAYVLSSSRRALL